MPRIDADDLIARLADPDTPESELRPYFEQDTNRSEPFAPRFRLARDMVDIPPGPEGAARSAQVLNGANWYCRFRRQQQFHRRIASGYRGPVIVSEGDSWFQYPIFLTDTIDHLSKEFAIYSLDAAGDLLEDMANREEHLKGLEDTGASVLLFSGGGNDLLAGGNLALHLEEFGRDLKPGDYLKRSFQTLLDSAIGQYERILRQVHGAFPAVTVFCHGYDYAIPSRGRWLGAPMEQRNIKDPALQKAITAEIMDQFNRALRRLCATMPHATYIDCRNVVRDDRWHDELHPTDEGYAAVAEKFAAEIRALANVRSGPRMVAVDGPFGRAEEIAREMPSPAVSTGREPNAFSLHVGLNRVDPGQYDGWSGDLVACVNDALAMEQLARRQGFGRNLVLLNEEATRDRVLQEMTDIAGELRAGDMFLFSISGHGSQIYDFNGDEVDDGAQPRDETMCLFDTQLIDDELNKCWSLFAEGVRIVTVADTCHSGTSVRMAMPASMPLPFAVPPERMGEFMAASRSAMPPSIAAEVNARARRMPDRVRSRLMADEGQKRLYRERQKRVEGFGESVVFGPASPVAASVLHLGACQDWQLAMDGDKYGAFTGALLRAWDQGRFKGNYRTFRERIDGIMADPEQTPNLFDKLVRDPSFLEQVPFALFSDPRTTGAGAAAGGAAPAPEGGAPAGEAPGAAPGGGGGRVIDPRAALVGEEGGEPDEGGGDARAERGGATRQGTTSRVWEHWDAFEAFVGELGLRWFEPIEFLELGGQHWAGGECRLKNHYPPPGLWQAMIPTAKVLDALRERLGKPVTITSGYRTADYNRCIGGADASQHLAFTAFDVKVAGVEPRDVAMALRWMRDRERAFSGGIGLYDTFVHVDTRGHDATWPDAFSAIPLPSRPPIPGSVQGMSRAERIAVLEGVELKALPRGTPQIRRSAFAESVPRTARDFDPTSDVVLRQNQLQAAVSANSLVSFVENLSAGQKEDVLLSTLFAQLAADKDHDRIDAREAWYRRYMEVLGLLGWVREEAPFETLHTTKSEGSVDAVVVNALARFASQGQMAIARTAIDALNGLAQNDGALKLFDRETSAATGGHFQIGTAEAAGEVISLALGAFSFTHIDRKQRILFVEWGTEELTFWFATEKLALHPSLYGDVRDFVRDALKTRRRRLIAEIELP